MDLNSALSCAMTGLAKDGNMGQGIATSAMLLFIWKCVNSFMKDSFIT